MKKRIVWVDIAKYICIMIVMIEHVETHTDVVTCFLVPFALQLFFFSAGYTHKPGQRAKAFFWKKVKTLLVPWLVFGLFDIMVSQLFSFQEHDLMFDLKWNFMQVRGFHGKLWFVAAIFVAYIPFYYFVEWFEKKEASPKNKRSLTFLLISYALFSLALIYTQAMDPSLLPWNTTELPWHMDYAFIGMFFMFLGYLFRKEHEAVFDKLNTRLNRLILLLVYSALVYAPYFVVIPERLFYIMAKVIVPITGLYLAIAYSKIIPPLRYLTYVGENTLIIFGLHGKLMGFLQGLFRHFAGGIYSIILSNTAYSAFFSIFQSVLMSVILIVPCYIINRWFPFVLGKSMKKPKERTS